MLVEVPFGHEFLDRMDPVFPEGMRYVRQVADIELSAPGSCFVAAFEDDTPMLVIGLLQLWNGVGEVFIVIDKKLVRSGNFFQAMRLGRTMLETFEDAGYRRLQGQWRVDCPCGKLARMMGFQREGILRNAGYNGVGDYVIAARVS